jgi:hypothetical protein
MIGKTENGLGDGRSFATRDAEIGLDGTGGSWTTRHVDGGLEGSECARILLESWGTQVGSVISCMPDCMVSGTARAASRPMKGTRGLADTCELMASCS